MQTGTRNKVIYAVYFAIFAVIWGVLFWKCRFGFASDEAIYLLVPFRTIGGDIPFLHEWHPTQISDIWIQPLVALFLKVNGGTEGIFLAFRYIFTAVWGVFAFFVFFRLRKISILGAAVSSLSLFIYVPFGEMALYYNTIGIITLLSSALIVLTADKWKPFQFAVAGALFAVSVTCCPFLAAGFLVLAVIAVVRKEKLFLFFTAGLAVIFAVFCCFYLSKASLSSIIDSIPHLVGDREHPFVLTDKIATYFISIFTSSLAFPAVFVLLLGPISFSLYHKDMRTRRMGFIVTVALVIILQAAYLVQGAFVNSFMFPPMFIAIYCFMNTKSKDIKNIFYLLWLPGFFYTICLHMSSNLEFGAISSAACIPSAAALIIAVLYIKEEFAEVQFRKIAIGVLSVLLVFQISVEMYKRVTYIFSERSLNDMTVKLENGSMKGIISTKNRQYYYTMMLYDIKPLIDENPSKVLILSPESWLYLDAGKNIGSYTCWSPIIDEYTTELLKEYYELYPDMKPDMIYVESYYNNLVPLISEGYSEETTVLGGTILRK